jgi:GNAT superfamily N-acetyltransferase
MRNPQRPKSQQMPVTTYLQMFSNPRQVVPRPRDDLAVIRATKPTLAYYRFLYGAVGKDWNWTSRKKLSDIALARIIHDPRDEVHVLYVDGVPAGFAELDRRVEGEVEISQFGLMSGFIGRGLGKYFLNWTVLRAWSYNPRRLWLHTCTEDHPSALPNYLKAGFAIYKEDTKAEE